MKTEVRVVPSPLFSRARGRNLTARSRFARAALAEPTVPHSRRGRRPSSQREPPGSRSPSLFDSDRNENENRGEGRTLTSVFTCPGSESNRHELSLTRF